ncbi:hypothetical protein GQR42_14490 [Microcystis aeruginosa FD4]|uniref:Uncharacterized protein n=2 Tax=Microcystis aeruginosa TaxID=1126 RepID=A0A857DA01_MICAE|nr:hypothetical protein GQR42_14490 [Microcystis aeruginosa FD4]
MGKWGSGEVGKWEMGKWGSGKWGSCLITPKPYHPKTLSPQNPITPKPYHPKTLSPEQCLRIDRKRDTMIGCSV